MVGSGIGVVALKFKNWPPAYNLKLLVAFKEAEMAPYLQSAFLILATEAIFQGSMEGSTIPHSVAKKSVGGDPAGQVPMAPL